LEIFDTDFTDLHELNQNSGYAKRDRLQSDYEDEKEDEED